jgi:hypothetical protein
MNVQALRDELLYLLRGGSAHLDVESALSGLPAKFRGAKVRGLPHTIWRLLEHLRLTQRDILDFCQDPAYVAPEFPGGYWPAGDAPPSASAWRRSVEGFRADLKAVEKLVASPKVDLFAPVPQEDGPSLLHEVLLLVDHNAYHLGQIVVLRRCLGAWRQE